MALLACGLSRLPDRGQRRRLHYDQRLDLRLDVRRQACRLRRGVREEVHRRDGLKPVFVDEAKKAVWTIDNPDAVKDFYGDHVTVKATADADKQERPHRIDRRSQVGLRPACGFALAAHSLLLSYPSLCAGQAWRRGPGSF